MLHWPQNSASWIMQSVAGFREHVGIFSHDIQLISTGTRNIYFSQTMSGLKEDLDFVYSSAP